MYVAIHQQDNYCGGWEIKEVLACGEKLESLAFYSASFASGKYRNCKWQQGVADGNHYLEITTTFDHARILIQKILTIR